MHLLHHLIFRNLDHYLAIGTFIHNWYEKKTECKHTSTTSGEKKNPKAANHASSTRVENDQLVTK